MPEFQSAAEWRAGVFAYAECIIAEETAHIPDGILARLDRLAAEGAISADSAAIARAWSGVAPGSAAYGGFLLELIKSVSFAPVEGADLADWWLRQSADEGDDDSGRLALWSVHWAYRASAEAAPASIGALGECERALLLDAAEGMPDLRQAFDALAAEEDCPREGGLPMIGAVAARVNVMRHRARLAGAEGARFERVSVTDAAWELGAAGREFFADCGRIRDAEELREVLASLDARGLGFAFCAACATPGHVIWMAAKGARGGLGYRWCGGCAVDGDRAPQSALLSPPTGALMALGGDIDFGAPPRELAALALAIALRRSPADAAALLAEEIERDDTSGARCSRVEACGRSCGRLQAADEAMPTIAANGDPDACGMREYIELAEGVEDDAEKWKIARRLIKLAQGEEDDEPGCEASAGAAESDLQGALL